MDLDSYVFITNSENFNILISFIVNPAKTDLIDNWVNLIEYFSNKNLKMK